MKLGFISLFLTGFFFGGAVDHFILGISNSPFTAYGIRSGVGGNWLLGLLDLVIALGLFLVFVKNRRTQKKF